jgi:hypothetical protein
MFVAAATQPGSQAPLGAPRLSRAIDLLSTSSSSAAISAIFDFGAGC